MAKKTDEQIENEKWEMKFYTNWIENGIFMPSRACQYVVWGVKDVAPDLNESILYIALGTGLHEAVYKDLAGAIKSGDITEVELIHQLREHGREIGREIIGGDNGTN